MIFIPMITNNACTDVVLIPIVFIYIPNKANTVELFNAILGHGSSIGSLMHYPRSKDSMVSRHFAITVNTFVLKKQTLYMEYYVR
jgi:hypothetical protein